MAPPDLLDRIRAFAIAVTGFARTLPKTDEAQDAARQLRRAANATRSNYRSARKGRSRAEFIAKLGVAREEADECADWLEYLRDMAIADNPTLLAEANELASILTASVKTASRNSNRTKIPASP
jgi:four helix bundle protein